MVTPDADPTPEDATIGAPAAGAGAPAASPGRLVSMALAAGLLGGVAAWLAGEAILHSYRDVLNPQVKREVDAEAVHRFARAQLTSARDTYTALGAIVGFSLGLAGGLARRSASAGAKAALVGGLLGAIAAASISLLVVPHFFKTHDPQSQDLMLPMLTVGSICSVIGGAGGLAFGVGVGGRGRWMKSLLGGLVGAALATVAYELIGAVAFATDKADLPISEAVATRAMLCLLVALFAAAGSALGLGLTFRKPNASPPTS